MTESARPPSDPPLDPAGATERFEHGPPATPIPPRLGPPTPTLGLPAAIPGFALEGDLGRGGSGIVFRARQVRLGRTVAVKLLRRADLDEPKEVARFVVEAESAAAIDHPNVVHIYEYGEHLGRPYLVLEFCPGGTLADRLRREGRLAPGAAASLVAAVADGAEAVHQAGVVHRDLKPGNVLFDAAGLPKVADFGLAKRRGSEADLTRTQAVLGSPAYMSPEQARGNTKFVGPPSDVWSLGVLLYECLTGGPPFVGPDPLAVLRRVAEDDPAPVRKLAPHTPADLALVCHKCLAKEPADRYPTAAALAADLRAVLAGRPVAARETGTLPRLGRWAKRHPGAAALWGGLALALAVAAVTSTLLAVEFRRQERAAADALARVTAERRATWEALNTLTDQATERLIAREPVLTAADRAFFADVLAQYDRAVARQDDGPDARWLAAHGQFRVARLRQRFGELAAAEAGYRAGADEFRAVLAATPRDVPAAHGLADCLEQLGWLLASLGRPAEGVDAAREALAVRRPLGDPARLGKTHGTFGLVLAAAGRRAEAAAEYRAAVPLLAPVPAARRELARVRVNLADALAADPGREAEAEDTYRAALADYAQLRADDPRADRDRLSAAAGRLNLGRLLARRGRPAEAAAEYAAGVDQLRLLVAEYPAYPGHRHELGRGLTLWATAARATGDRGEAARLAAEAVAHHRRAVDGEPANTRHRAAWAANRKLVAELVLDTGDHAAAAGLADEFAEATPAADQKGLTAAVLLVKAARLARWDVRRAAAERAATADGYETRAVGRLLEAVAGGHLTADRVRAEPAFARLAGRADFRAVVGR